MCILPWSPGAACPRTASTVLRNRVSQRRVSPASSTSRRRRAPLAWPTWAAHAPQCAHLASSPCGPDAAPGASTRGIRNEKCEPVASACAVPSGAWAPALWRASHRGRPETTARSRRRPLTIHPLGTEPSAVRAPGLATSNCSCPSAPHARATQRACRRARGWHHRRDDQGPPVTFVARTSRRRADMRTIAVQWAERTAREQGLPVKIEDEATLRVVATLLCAGRYEPGRIRRAMPGSAVPGRNGSAHAPPHRRRRNRASL